ncbi:substrate-binding domain-containing protein [Tropicimonas sp. IMCC6043]|uniref:substrate-binding domain-containing protein n=1 Tax=Tropicimonas sp. IMCC6043 TaxID=2510645 RepID=UPI00101D3489|nr:substrate-binding domain-containing protein [Tropicimonas sp. IMCC6043]RYH12398.1 sugar ABC transporter substrate-binding protein [Tropicimonas sp. IMCC6043]
MLKTLVSAAVLAMAATTGMAQDKPTVAYVVKEINPYFNVMLDGAQAAADELGVTLLTSAAANQTAVEQQMSIVEDFISQKVDAIVIAPIDSKALVPVLERATKAGIKVVNVDNRLDKETMAAMGVFIPYVGVNDEDSAYNAAKAVVDALGGTGKVAILEGIRGADNAQARKRGAEKAFAEAPGIEIVASQTANWQAEEALNVMTNIIQANPDLAGVFAANDMMSFGVIQAISAAGKDGKVVIASIDAEDQAKANIKEGKALATVYQNQDAQAAKAVEVALDLINGKEVADDIKVETILITKEDL